MPLTLNEILSTDGGGRAAVMGILNVTPDSFSDGGEFLAPGAGARQAREMIAAGADIIDIGAESTRPGSERVGAAEQIARIERILPAVVGGGAVVSIDTTLAEVAAFGLDGGAEIINDVSAGRDDSEMLPLAARRGAAIVLMHMLGEPKTMQAAPRYEDVVSEVVEFLGGRVAAAEAAGIPRQRCIIDPGIGFGKELEHNLALLGHLDRLGELNCPILVGPSRKRFIGELTGVSVAADRVAGTIAACLSARRGGAGILRVHDVGAVVEALKVAEAIDKSGRAAPEE